MELKFDPKAPNFKYITSLDDANAALEILEKSKMIAVDVETSGLDPYSSNLLLVQLGTEDTSYIFDARKIKLRDFPRFKDLLENGKVLKILQNAKFDYQHIKVNTGIEITNIYDTYLAEEILKAGLGGIAKSLKALASRYVQIELEKETAETFLGHTGKINEGQLVYAAKDTLVLFPIFQEQYKLIVKENLLDIAKLEFAETKVVAEMELKGVLIRVDKWKDILKNLSVKRDDLSQQFQDAIRGYYNSTQIDLFGNMADVININSQVQLMDLFNNKLKINIPSTGDAVLAGIDHPIAKILRDYRGYEKLISAFGEKLLEKINKKTGRIHPDLMQMGTATGRFACANPNLQQIPKNSKEAPFRECFGPAPGYKLTVADYSSMEMRILADLADDEKFLKALREGLDVHSYTAALMFNKEYSEDFKKQYPDLRQAAKTINFGLMYGMGSVGLARQINVTPEVGQQYIDLYFKNYQKVKKWLDRLASDALRNGWSMTPAGRKRWYRKPERDDPDFRKKTSKIEREAKNHPIQGTNADVTKYALVFLHDRLKKEGIDGYVTHTVHDEIVCEVREDQAEYWLQAHKEEMIRAGELFLKKVPVQVDGFVGDVWDH